MISGSMSHIFTPAVLEKIFPRARTDRFFEALFGTPEDGAYDIGLAFKTFNAKTIEFEFHLTRRTGRCLACNLTYGLPQVFSRHPVINIKGVVNEISQLLDQKIKITGWKIGSTKEISRTLHVIPLTVFTENSEEQPS